MSKKLINKIILLLGITLIAIGFLLIISNKIKKNNNKQQSDLNISLFENEIPNNIPAEQNSNNKKYEKFNYIGILEIPKINLKNGFLNLNSKYNNIENNITTIKGSTLPDERNNNLILAAHSGNCDICYFNKLYKLSINDTAFIYYKNLKYTYIITNIYEVEKTGKVKIKRNYNKNTLTLITCTHNSNTKQTIYILELISKEKY